MLIYVSNQIESPVTFVMVMEMTVGKINLSICNVHLCMYVCVCVCAREIEWLSESVRERERIRRKVSQDFLL